MHMGEAQRRALAARVATAEGAALTAGAYAALVETSAPDAQAAATDVVQAIAAFSAACDGIFRDYRLPATLRDRRIPLAEQLGRLEASLENVSPPRRAVGLETLTQQVALADLRLAIHALEQAAHGLQPTPMRFNADAARRSP